MLLSLYLVQGNWKPLNKRRETESVSAVVTIVILNPFNLLKRGF